MEMKEQDTVLYEGGASTSTDAEMQSSVTSSSDEEEFESESQRIEKNCLVVDGVRHDVKDFYSLVAEDNSYSKKFRVAQKNLTFRLHELANDTPCIEGLFDKVLNDLVETSKPIGDNLYVSVGVTQDGSTKNFGMRAVPYPRFSASTLRREMTTAETSTGIIAPLVLGNIELRVSWVEMPVGSGKTAIEASPRDDNITRVIGNNCLPKAVSVGIAYLNRKHEPSKWRTLSRRVKPQQKAALELLNHLGLPRKDSYDLKDVKAMRLPNHQLIVFDGAKHPLFRGPFAGDGKVIGLRLKTNHYDHIKKIPAFFGTKYYCGNCNSLYKSRDAHYNCPLRCSLCTHPRIEDCAGQLHKECSRCRFVFNNEDCFKRHLEQGVQGGASRCERVQICETCNQVIDEGRKGRAHVCGTSFCPRCKTDMPKDHPTCFVAPASPISSRFKLKTIAFDIESTVVSEDGKNVHKPNVIIAIRSCSACQHSTPESHESQESCNQCGGRRVHVWHCLDGCNRDLVSEFVKWLNLKENRNATVLAHNLKGYDGQFLLRTMMSSDDVPSKMILSGLKLMHMVNRSVRFVDTLNFLQMPLASFPKAFGIPELKKGYFPHLFNRPENYNYVGTVPELTLYNPTQMKEEAKAVFLEWHRAQHDIEFNFRREILAYCYSDVALLSRGATAFDTECFRISGTHVFHETTTAASAAMLIFRRNFLKREKLAIEAPILPCKRQSILALKFLAYLRETKGKRIQDATHGGEHRVSGTRYHVDGYIPREGKKPIAIEIHGCYFHACTCSYQDDAVKLGRTAAEIRRDDKLRLEVLEQRYKVKVYRECEINKMLRRDEEMRTIFMKHRVLEPLDIHDAFFGGRTETFKLHAKCQEGWIIRYLDVYSLYPFTNKYKPYPIGVGVYVSGEDIPCPINEAKDLGVNGFLKCRVLAPYKLHLPVLCMRVGGKCIYALCQECALKKSSERTSCSHTDEERAFEGTWATEEIKLALKNGYKVLKVYEGRHYAEWSKYEMNPESGEARHGVLSEYMNTFVKLKTEASGWPRDVGEDVIKQAEYIAAFKQREGVTLDPSKMQPNSAARQVAKLMLNSLWGKLGERPGRKQQEMIVSPERLHSLLIDAETEVGEIIVLTDEKLWVSYKKKAGHADPISTTSLASAVLTTAYARVKLYEIISRVMSSRLLYCDTDSVIYLHKDCKEDPLEQLKGYFLGDLTDEIPGRGTEFVSQGPKTYAYKYVTDEGLEKTVVKCKGFPLTSDASQKIHFEQMRQFVREMKHGERPNPVMVTYDRIVTTRNHMVTTLAQEKRLNAVFDKRVILKESYCTFPYGYRE